MPLDIVPVLASTVRFSTPLTFAALGGIISERSGIVNIGLEGMMLTGAFFGVFGSYLTGNPWIGLAFAVGSAGVLGLLHALMTIRFQADQIISGTAINLIALGGTSYLLNQIYGHPGSSPQVQGFNDINVWLLHSVPIVGPILFSQSAFIWAALLATPGIWWLLWHTALGLRLRASGEAPGALESAGVNVIVIRYAAVTASGALCGVAGAYLSLSLLSAFSENMTAGRGFIALAAVIFSGWRAGRALLATLFFGFTDAIVIRFPQDAVSPEFLYMIPYVATIVALVIFGGRAVGPASVGKPYQPGRSRS